MTYRSILLFALVILVLQAGCAARKDPAVSVAVEDFIAVAQLEELDKIRTRNDYSWEYLSERFISVKTRDGEYLLRFQRRCRELYEVPVQPDIRFEPNLLRARFDTIRGCRIDKLYAIEPGQADELRQLGWAPGDEP